MAYLHCALRYYDAATQVLPVTSSLFMEATLDNLPQERRGLWLTLLGTSFGLVVRDGAK